MRPFDWMDSGWFFIGAACGFAWWRLLERVQLSGARMRHRLAIAELRRAEADALREARYARLMLDDDARLRARATAARAFEDARQLGDQSDAIAPGREFVGLWDDDLDKRTRP